MQEAVDRNDWIARYAAGESSGELAREAGVTSTSVRAWLRRRGVAMRTLEAGLALYRRRHRKPAGWKKARAPTVSGELTLTEFEIENHARIYPDQERQEWIRQRMEEWIDRRQ